MFYGWWIVAAGCAVWAVYGMTGAYGAGLFYKRLLDDFGWGGPSWQGLFGSEEKLADGGSVTVDDAYLRESILAPDAKITEGFQAGLMPKTFADTLSASDVNDLIALIGSL